MSIDIHSLRHLVVEIATLRQMELCLTEARNNLSMAGYMQTESLSNDFSIALRIAEGKLCAAIDAADQGLNEGDASIVRRMFDD